MGEENYLSFLSQIPKILQGFQKKGQPASCLQAGYALLPTLSWVCVRAEVQQSGSSNRIRDVKDLSSWIKFFNKQGR